LSEGELFEFDPKGILLYHSLLSFVFPFTLWVKGFYFSRPIISRFLRFLMLSIAILGPIPKIAIEDERKDKRREKREK